MGKCWSFRGDDELDPILEKWSKRHEKSYHIRQAIRQYRTSGCKYVEVDERVQEMPVYDGEISLDEWG